MFRVLRIADDEKSSMLLVMRVLSILPLTCKVSRRLRSSVGVLASLTAAPVCVNAFLLPPHPHPHPWPVSCPRGGWITRIGSLPSISRNHGPRLCHENCSCSTRSCGRSHGH